MAGPGLTQPSPARSDFTFTKDNVRKSLKVILPRREERVETEPLYRVPAPSKADPDSADEYLKSALQQHPRLFEIRGTRKSLAQRDQSPVCTGHSHDASPRARGESANSIDLGTGRIEVCIPSAKPSRRPSSAAAPKTDGGYFINPHEGVAAAKAQRRPSTASSAADRPQPQKVETTTQTQSLPPSARKMLVVDKAFLQAKKIHGAMISLRMREVLVLLNVVGCASDKEERITDAYVELSLTSPLLFAGSLTAFCQRYDLHPPSQPFVCTEDMATKAIANMNALVEGAWRKARVMIMNSCKAGANKASSKSKFKRKAPRPACWSTEAVNDLLVTLQLPPTTQLDSGSDFMSLTSVESLFSSNPAPAPSLLKYRAKFYQTVLRLLDSWWDCEPRQHPHDLAEDMVDTGLMHTTSSRRINQTRRAGRHQKAAAEPEAGDC